MLVVYDESIRRTVGLRLLELERQLGRVPGRVLALLAETLGVTERTLRNWMQAARKGVSTDCARSAQDLVDEARVFRRVARAWKRCGRSSGEGAVFEALGGDVSLRTVRVHLRRMKGLWREHRSARRVRERVSASVQTRDVIWSLDATHLGRDAQGEVQAETLRDPASTSALALSAGRASNGEEVAKLLEETSEERGGPPLALAVDGGANYASVEVRNWAQANQVVIMQSLPHVPQHNPWVERGHRELKEDADLGKGVWLDTLPCARWTLIGSGRELVDGWSSVVEQKSAGGGPADKSLPRWCRRLARSLRVLNEERARPSRGGWTASALDAVLPRGDDLVRRESFYRAACRNANEAVLAAPNARARRRARRNAILCTLESYGLVRRTRGGRPWSQPISES